MTRAAPVGKRALGGLKRRQQLADTFPPTGQHGVRRDLRQRREHETPQVGARMWQREPGRAPLLPAKRDQVQVQRARFVEDLFGATPKRDFERLEFVEQ